MNKEVLNSLYFAAHCLPLFHSYVKMFTTDLVQKISFFFFPNEHSEFLIFMEYQKSNSNSEIKGICERRLIQIQLCE